MKRRNPDVDNIAICYRIYPTENQIVFFKKTIGCCRKVWNLLLLDVLKYYEENHEYSINTPAFYKEKYTYLKSADSLALCNVQLKLHEAFCNYFSDPDIYGVPRFKAKYRERMSYTTNKIGKNIVIGDNFIKLPKVGRVNAVIHREPDSMWRLKSATISMKQDGTWYVSVLFEMDYVSLPCVPVERETTLGIAMSPGVFYVDSNGEFCEFPDYYQKTMKQFEHAKRSLMRKELGSNSYDKQKQRVDKLAVKLQNQRKDFLHKRSTEIANAYSCVSAEMLNLRVLAPKGFSGKKEALDIGFGDFKSMLSYKMRYRGKTFVTSDYWFPASQICSSCGNRFKVCFEDKNYVCPFCGMILDKNVNCAINIKEDGLRLLNSISDL